MEDCQNNQSSAYSSLANSSTEINESKFHTPPRAHHVASLDMELAATRLGRTAASSGIDTASSIASAAAAVASPNAEQIRNISDDYNKLLKRATSEIKSLTAEKLELQDQCDKLLTVNEDLAANLSKVLRTEAETRRENERIIRANEELFSEAQRLSDEETRWAEERDGFDNEVKELRDQLNSIESKLRSSSDEPDLPLSDALDRLTAEKRRNEDEFRAERRKWLEDMHKLESEMNVMAAQIKGLEEQNDNLVKRKEKISGENMQLMLESDGQAKAFKTKVASVTNQLAKAKDRVEALERENGRLRSAHAAAQARAEEANSSGPGAQGGRAMEALMEKNKNLTEWREQLIAKNKALVEENEKLKAKCQNLEDLMNEEETDIADVLELIRQMQHSPNGLKGAVNNPISKFRDLDLIKK